MPTVADNLQWFLRRGRDDIEKTADLEAEADFYTLDELRDVSVADSDHPYCPIFGSETSWARRPKPGRNQPSPQEVDIFTAMSNNKAPESRP